MTDEDLSWTVVTGSTGGIGSELADILSSKGHALILINRSEVKAQIQAANLAKRYPGLPAKFYTADLMDTVQIRGVISKIAKLPGRIDALYNNSGVLTSERVLSPQGYESQFAVNTLAPFMLIRGFSEKLAGVDPTDPAMIVNFSSSAISSVRNLDVAQLANPDKVGGLLTTYAHTKLAVTAMAPALADELSEKNILIRAIDPGATKTPMTTSGGSGMPRVLAWIAPLLFSPADRQAQKVVSSAAPSAHQFRTGIYVANEKEKKLPASASDPTVQRGLIDKLEELART